MAYDAEVGGHLSGVSTARRRRRRRAAITLAVVGLMLLAVFLYAAAYFQGWVGKDPAPPAATPTCTPTTAATPLAPAKVNLNVYNATARNGLAASVAAQLRRQGFRIVKVANDPLGRSIAGTGQIRYGAKGAAAATTVRQRLPSAELLPDNRSAATVDLVLGETFVKLTVPPRAPRPTPGKTSAKATGTPAPTSGAGGAAASPGATGTIPAC